MRACKINPFVKPTSVIEITLDATKCKQLTTKPYCRAEPGGTSHVPWSLLLFTFQTISQLKNDIFWNQRKASNSLRNSLLEKSFSANFL